jgi:hypothetical protein
MQTGIKANTMTSLFPEGVNVTFYTSMGKQAIYTETFERGAGLTQACGTAMSACSVAACMRGLCRYGEWIDIYNKGGMVKCLVESRNGKNGGKPEGGLLINTEPELLTKVGIASPKISVRLLGNATFEYSAAVDFDNTAMENPATNPAISATNPAVHATTTATLKTDPALPKTKPSWKLGHVFKKTTCSGEIAAYNRFLKSVGS